MVFIPHQTFTATVQGSLVKLVQCESCSGEYVYRMSRSARGSGSSVLFLDNDGARRRAMDQAQSTLKKLLEKGCDPVPCPNCGWYQMAMVRESRRRYLAWMRNLAFICLGLGAVVYVIALGSESQPGRSVGLVTAGLGLAIAAARRFLQSMHDPNTQEEDARLKLGQQRAITRADFEQALAEQQEQAAGT